MSENANVLWKQLCFWILDSGFTSYPLPRTTNHESRLTNHVFWSPAFKWEAPAEAGTAKP